MIGDIRPDHDSQSPNVGAGNANGGIFKLGDHRSQRVYRNVQTRVGQISQVNAACNE